MKNYQGKRKYFEGWYYKHQKDDELVILIPGIAIDREREYAFIQIITKENSYHIEYPMSECFISRSKEYIRIGNSRFSKKGIRVNMNSKDLSLRGIIKYTNITPIHYPIMGIFRFAPGMECNHEILSMCHDLQGSLIVNDKKISFNHGIGYIEKDWGYSFPKTYVWLQCNQFLQDNCAITVSVAQIPFAGFHFKGCICVIHYKGKEYRLATYLGVRIVTCCQEEICLQQGEYRLRIKLFDSLECTGDKDINGLKKTEKLKDRTRGKINYKLLAPDSGKMTRTIEEQNYYLAEYRFYQKDQLLFELTSDKTSLEIVE